MVGTTGLAPSARAIGLVSIRLRLSVQQASGLALPLSFVGHPKGQCCQNTPHQPTLDHDPTGMACEESGNRTCGQCEGHIDGETDGDLRKTQDHGLREDAALLRIDELRQ